MWVMTVQKTRACSLLRSAASLTCCMASLVHACVDLPWNHGNWSHLRRSVYMNTIGVYMTNSVGCLSCLERTCPAICFHLPSLSSAKDVVKFTHSQWTLSSQSKVGRVFTAIVCLWYYDPMFFVVTGWSMLLQVLICCHLNTSTSLFSLVLAAWAMATLHKVAYGSCVIRVCVNVALLFSSVQSPCLCRDSGSVGRAVHASGSRRSEKSSRVLHQRRGKCTLA